MSDDLTAWLLLLGAGAIGGPLVAWGLGCLGPAKPSAPACRAVRHRQPRRKLRLAGTLLALLAGLSFPPANCVQKATAAGSLASARSGMRTWAHPEKRRGAPCPTEPCP